jgi:hypothetical protein
MPTYKIPFFLYGNDFFLKHMDYNAIIIQQLQKKTYFNKFSINKFKPLNSFIFS